MAAAILTLVVTLMAAGGLWLFLGAKLRLSKDEQVNGLLNLLAYYFVGLPIIFVIVFVVVG